MAAGSHGLDLAGTDQWTGPRALDKLGNGTRLDAYQPNPSAHQSGQPNSFFQTGLSVNAISNLLLGSQSPIFIRLRTEHQVKLSTGNDFFVVNPATIQRLAIKRG